MFLRPVGQKMGDDLGLDGYSWLVQDHVRGQVDYPFRDAAGCVLVADVVSERSHAHHGDDVLLEVVA